MQIKNSQEPREVKTLHKRFHAHQKNNGSCTTNNMSTQKKTQKKITKKIIDVKNQCLCRKIKNKVMILS